MNVDVGRIDKAYDLYARELLSFATSLVGPTNAQDVVSNALLRLLTNPVWAEAKNQRAVLHRAVYYEGLTWLRSDQRRLTRETRWSLLQGPTESEIGAFADSALTDALEVLSVQQRAVIYLTYWRDQSIAEVSETLEISDGATRKQLARARAKLRKVMTK